MDEYQIFEAGQSKSLTNSGASAQPLTSESFEEERKRTPSSEIHKNSPLAQESIAA